MMKYIMAFGVVTIHVGTVYGRFPSLIEWFISLAVPFFFLTSGYLLSRKLESEDSIAQKRIMLRRRACQIFRLFGIWLLIYLPVACAVLYMRGEPPLKAIAQLVCQIILLGEMPYAWPLWFLYSLGIFTFALSYAIGAKKGMCALVGAATLSYIAFQAVMAIDMETLPHIAQTAARFLPFRAIGGGCYILAGMLCHGFAGYLEKQPWLWPALTAAGIVMYLTAVPTAELIGGIGMFLAALRLQFPQSSSTATSLRYQSMWIYYLHMIFIFAATFVFERSTSDHWIVLAIICTATAAASFSLTRLQEKPRFHFLSNLVK